MTEDEFWALPVTSGSFVLWMDPSDRRCGWIPGEYGIEWTIGKARIDKNGRWDPKAEWQLVRQHRYSMFETGDRLAKEG